MERFGETNEASAQEEMDGAPLEDTSEHAEEADPNSWGAIEDKIEAMRRKMGLKNSAD